MTTSLLVWLALTAIIVVFLFTREYKDKITNFSKNLFVKAAQPVALISIEKKPSPLPPNAAVLTAEQIKKLFDNVIPKYWNARTVTPEEGTIRLTVRGVGTWAADAKEVKISSSWAPPTFDAEIVIVSVGVFNEIINQKDFTRGYLVSLVLTGKLSIKGDYNKLVGFEQLISILLEKKNEILKEL